MPTIDMTTVKQIMHGDKEVIKIEDSLGNTIWQKATPAVATDIYLIAKYLGTLKASGKVADNADLTDSSSYSAVTWVTDPNSAIANVWSDGTNLYSRSNLIDIANKTVIDKSTDLGLSITKAVYKINNRIITCDTNGSIYELQNGAFVDTQITVSSDVLSNWNYMWTDGTTYYIDNASVHLIINPTTFVGTIYTPSGIQRTYYGSDLINLKGNIYYSYQGLYKFDSSTYTWTKVSNVNFSNNIAKIGNTYWEIGITDTTGILITYDISSSNEADWTKTTTNIDLSALKVDTISSGVEISLMSYGFNKEGHITKNTRARPST